MMKIEFSKEEELQSVGGCNIFITGLVRDLNPGPLVPKARIIPLDQRAMRILDVIPEG